MDKHNLLIRQLKRTQLSENTLPTDLNHWQEFLSRVNHSYLETDQERYLLERSMEVSSTEMMKLNNKLEEAQHIAHLGYWQFDKGLGKIYWSKEIYNLFGIDPSKGTPDFAESFQLIHPEDQPHVEQLVERAFTLGEPYQVELRCKYITGEYRWYYIEAHPIATQGVFNMLSGILMDVTNRKKIEEEIVNLHQQLLVSARQAGMAEVATAVLHNIGNILNSAYVSLELMQELAKHSYVSRFLSTARLLYEHGQDITQFLTEDPKGKLIPEYLMNLSQKLSAEYNSINNEVTNLNVHLQHIKEIVLIQKDLSGLSGIIEKIYLPEIIDLAVQMSSVVKNNISINKNYDIKIYIMVDRAKLLQVLVNVIRNAKDALLEISDNRKKEITIMAKKQQGAKNIEIIISDNGIGISSDNLTRIFSLGFTTKPQGHGFGLHSSSLAAKELGGHLRAESDGKNKGATFILVLPIEAKSQKGALQHDTAL